MVEARVVGRPDPPLRAVEELLRCRAQPSGDLDPERDDELCIVLGVLVVLRVVATARPVGALETICFPRQLSRVGYVLEVLRTLSLRPRHHTTYAHLYIPT